MTNLSLAVENEEPLQKTAEKPPRSLKPRKSMRSAINEMCRECICDDQAPGNWRQQVTGCTVLKCPLYELRPVSKPRTRAEDGGESEEDDEDGK